MRRIREPFAIAMLVALLAGCPRPPSGPEVRFELLRSSNTSQRGDTQSYMHQIDAPRCPQRVGTVVIASAETDSLAFTIKVERPVVAAPASGVLPANGRAEVRVLYDCSLKERNSRTLDITVSDPRAAGRPPVRKSFTFEGEMIIS